MNDYDNRNRHAYLVLAHKDNYTFRTLLKMLDDPGNDIFIHMDIKNTTYDIDSVKACVKKSTLYHTERIKVTWAGYSIIEAELILLEEALLHGPYAFYHLLSGQDLPIKTQDYIHRFFDKNNGKEFVRFFSDVFQFNERVKYYHIFQEYVGRKIGVLWLVEKIIVKAQAIFRINRNQNIDFKKGSQWFSITHNLAAYVISKREWIKSTFQYTYCCDEVFLQTIVHNSSFKNSLYYEKYDNSLYSFVRLIDWDRGTPYIFKMDDVNELINSNMMFARKFDCNIDKEIIDYIYEKFG